MTTSWRELIRSLGEAFGVLLSSEVAAFKADLERSRRRLLVALILACGAVFMLFWAVGVSTVVAFEALSTTMERWLAALIVLLTLIAVGGALAALAVRKFRSIEKPMATAQRHLSDHVGWWQEKVLQQQETKDERNITASPGEAAGDPRSR